MKLAGGGKGIVVTLSRQSGMKKTLQILNYIKEEIVYALRRQSGTKNTLRVLQKFNKKIVAALRRQFNPQITGLRITEKLHKYGAGGIES